MKKSFLILVLMFSLSLLSCGGGEEASIELIVPTSPLALIPAKATSCLGRLSSSTGDISASYFKVPTFKITRKTSTKTLIVSLIRITIQIPITGKTLTCQFGGDELAALSTTWWASASREAVIPAGTSTYSTDCPIVCGGVDTSKSFVASGPIEVFGLERDETTLDETPVKVQGTVSIQSY
jgi:hypothetical protein